MQKVIHIDFKTKKVLWTSEKIVQLKTFQKWDTLIEQNKDSKRCKICRGYVYHLPYCTNFKEILDV